MNYISFYDTPSIYVPTDPIGTRTDVIPECYDFPVQDFNGQATVDLDALPTSYQQLPAMFVPIPTNHQLSSPPMMGGSPPISHHQQPMYGLRRERRYHEIQPAFEPQGFTRSSSEDYDPGMPQQHRRKAQNRAAQRAFRERKEKHVKDLETRNATLERQSQDLRDQVDKLNQELEEIKKENETLRTDLESCSSHQQSPAEKEKSV